VQQFPLAIDSSSDEVVQQFPFALASEAVQQFVTGVDSQRAIVQQFPLAIDSSSDEVVQQFPFALASEAVQQFVTGVDSQRAIVQQFALQITSVDELVAAFFLAIDGPANDEVVQQFPLALTGVIDAFAVITPTNSMTHKGRKIPIADYRLGQNWDSYAWEGQAAIVDYADYIRIKTGDAVTLNIQGTDYALVVQSKRLSDDGSSGQAQFNLRLASPVMTLAASRITKTYEADTARSIVQDLLGQAVTWGIVDWSIPGGVVVLDEGNPVESARAILAAVGGILQSNPNGTLKAQYKTGNTAWNRLGTANSAAIYTDREHIFDYADEPPGDVWNAVTIADETGADLDASYNADYEETGRFTGWLRIYPTPWVTDFSLTHTGDDSIKILDHEVEYILESQTVEFTQGKASVSHPIYNLVSLEWQHRDLDPVTWQIDSKELTAEGGEGYSIATVQYMRRVRRYPIQHGLTAPELTQFLVLEPEAV
jgi:hypothetical protein